jgi:hypothetical protein
MGPLLRHAAILGTAQTMALLLMAAAAPDPVRAQSAAMERLPANVLDVTSPAARVRGTPGTMAVQQRPCRVLPTNSARRRVVDVAVQEWAFFGFRVVDRTEPPPPPVFDSSRTGANGDAPGLSRAEPSDLSRAQPGGGRRRSRIPPDEAARVAASIAGYWAVTPEGSWIVSRQNDEWTGADGIGARWNAPWSAAFISWVMCEGGLGSSDQFRRAIAHHSYIDQALRARDGRLPSAAFAAYDVGESAISPGDLLCSSRQPVYRTLAERRRQMGVGARTHCDIVVEVDEARERILAIGGNVRGIVALKVLRADRQPGRPLRVDDPDEERPIFAHLKLRADVIAAAALGGSATMKALGCDVTARVPALIAANAAGRGAGASC